MNPVMLKDLLALLVIDSRRTIAILTNYLHEGEVDADNGGEEREHANQ